ncbi:MAG TPA: hypothetical protein PLJ21_04350 [Pseudobdellovibrionaceae bacterium]|nr:hypothetical protein [Pseudobdellovibrionaceae bacterium]
MKKNEILLDTMKQAEKSTAWLLRSYNKCRKIDFSKEVVEDDLDQLEALTSRFARLADILIHKVFRSIEISELEIPGTIIDTVNRIAKRGIIKDPDAVRDIKDLRNTISHEYSVNEILLLFQDVLNKTPDLLDIFSSAQAYCQKNKLI